MPRFRRVTALLIIASVVAHASAAGQPSKAPQVRRATPNLVEFDELRRRYVELQRDMVLADRREIVPGSSQIAGVRFDGPARDGPARGSVGRNRRRGRRRGGVSARQQDALRRGASAMVYLGPVPAVASVLSATISGARNDGRCVREDHAAAAARHRRRLASSRSSSRTPRPRTCRTSMRESPAQTTTWRRSETACDWLFGCPIAAARAIAADLQYRSVLYPTLPGSARAGAC